MFNVLLGSVNPLPYDMFDNTSLFLTMKVGTDNEMKPRKRMVSIGYAVHAHKADSLSDFSVSEVTKSVDGVAPDNFGNIDLTAGSNITITPEPGSNNITISAAGDEGGGGDITAVIAGNGLTGGAESADAILHVGAGTGVNVTNDNVGLNTDYLDDQYLNKTGPEHIYGLTADFPDPYENPILKVTDYANGPCIICESSKADIIIGDNVNVFKGQNKTTNSYGIIGHPYYGFYGHSGDLATSAGVIGLSTVSHGLLGSDEYAVFGGREDGLFGYFGSEDYGVYGEYSKKSYGFLGDYYYAVYGKHEESSNYGYIAGANYSMLGYHYNSNNWAGIGSSSYAGYFRGNVNINGTLNKSAGSFIIDHPLDPGNKYLCHSFVESPDMKNIYDGVAVLNSKGEAVVELPEWFESLNRDFRYQLTCIGGYAQVYIQHEVADHQFKIAGGYDGLKVSWQVTGIRKDAYAEAYPIEVEIEKSREEKGKYRHPELYGLPVTMRIDNEIIEQDQIIQRETQKSRKSYKWKEFFKNEQNDLD